MFSAVLNCTLHMRVTAWIYYNLLVQKKEEYQLTFELILVAIDAFNKSNKL